VRANCMVSVEAPWARPWLRRSCHTASMTRIMLMPQCDSNFLSSMERTAWRSTAQAVVANHLAPLQRKGADNAAFRS